MSGRVSPAHVHVPEEPRFCTGCKIALFGLITVVALAAIVLGCLAQYLPQDFEWLDQTQAIAMIGGGCGSLVVLVAGALYYKCSVSRYRDVPVRSEDSARSYYPRPDEEYIMFRSQEKPGQICVGRYDRDQFGTRITRFALHGGQYVRMEGDSFTTETLEQTIAPLKRIGMHQLGPALEKPDLTEKSCPFTSEEVDVFERQLGHKEYMIYRYGVGDEATKNDADYVVQTNKKLFQFRKDESGIHMKLAHVDDECPNEKQTFDAFLDNLTKAGWKQRAIITS